MIFDVAGACAGRRSWAVVALCGAMMAAEIVGGLLWGSMALIAEGLHMSTHVGALVIVAFACAYDRIAWTTRLMSLGQKWVEAVLLSM